MLLPFFFGVGVVLGPYFIMQFFFCNHTALMGERGLVSYYCGILNVMFLSSFLAFSSWCRSVFCDCGTSWSYVLFNLI